tara:strand:+ start:138 stop:728 length:591 start_codon:yes stop_codon:yes gene_type:complete
MNKKTVIQLLLITIIILSSFFLYNEYKNSNKEIIKLETKKDLEEDSSDAKNEFNLLKNIKYISKDSSNNVYEIYAEEGRIEYDKPDITYMKNVKAYIFFSQDDVIEINSKYATYNSLNYNTLFRDNISVKYFLHKITCEKLDISFEDNIAYFYEDLIYESKEMKMNADKLEIDLISKNSKITMFDTEKKISIINKN